jgi:quercetin dioxygenase-like cupin family protein
MLSGAQTGGMLAVMVEQTHPGGGPPLHVHHNEDEIFIVIEGKIQYYVEGEWHSVDPGGVVYLPRGAAHCYRNAGNTPSRHWILTTPAGFEIFFARCAAEFARNDDPEMSHIIEIHHAHGIELLDR